MCTAIYVGKKLSADGTTIIARSCDHADDLNMISCIKCKEESVSNDNCITSLLTDRKYKLPTTTNKFLSCPSLPSDIGILSSLTINEHGLAVSATLTAYSTKEIKALDPLVEDGISEDILAEYLGATCKTARECVDKIALLVDERGIQEENTIMTADQNECWYIELYTGHQWAAIKLPDDKIAAYGNHFNIKTEYIQDDKSSFLHSDDLFNLAKNAGLDINIDGKMSLCDTYGGKNRLADYSNLRTWMAHNLLGDKNTKEYSTNKRFDFLFDSENKISMQQIFEVFRNRYEGTKYDENSDDFDKRRVIGAEGQFNVHVAQVNQNLPKEMCINAWICLTNCEHSVFLPYNNLQTKIQDNYRFFDAYNYMGNKKTPMMPNNRLLVYSDDIAAICFQRLCYLAETDRSIYGGAVRQYWHDCEKDLIEKFPKIIKQTEQIFEKDKTEAIDYINSHVIDIQTKTLADAKALYDELLWYIMGHTDTLKYHFNYQLLDYDPEKLQTQPFKPCFFFRDKYLDELS